MARVGVRCHLLLPICRTYGTFNQTPSSEGIGLYHPPPHSTFYILHSTFYITKTHRRASLQRHPSCVLASTTTRPILHFSFFIFHFTFYILHLSLFLLQINHLPSMIKTLTSVVRQYTWAVVLLIAHAGYAQPDTSYGEGRIQFLYPNGLSVDSTEVVMTPLVVEDSLPNVIYTYTTDTAGEIFYDVITRLNYRLRSEDFTDPNIRVHPVPGNEVNVFVPLHYQARGPLTLTLNDQRGTTVENQVLTGAHAYFSLQHLPVGPYILRVTDAGGMPIHHQKIIKQEAPLYGPQQSTTTRPIKRIQTTNAEYEVVITPQNHYDSLGRPTQLGHYPFDTIMTIEPGVNPLVTYDLKPWKQDSVPRNIRFRDPVTNQQIGGPVPLLIQPDSINLQFPNMTKITTTNTWGTVEPFFLTYTDTLNQSLPAQSEAKWNISWDTIITLTAADSNATNINKRNYLPGDTTFTIENNITNPFLSLIPKRMEEDWQNWVGNYWVEGYVVDLDKQPLENVMIVAGYAPQGTSTINRIDTAYTDSTGYYRFAQPFPSGATQTTNRTTLTWAVQGDTSKYFAWQGDQMRGPIVTLNDPDTIREVNWTLLPKVALNRQGTDSITATAQDYRNYHNGFNIMYSIHDTLNFHIDSASYGAGANNAYNTIINTLDSLQSMWGINYTLSAQPFPTGAIPSAFWSNPPVTTDYWMGDHRLVGTNITAGSNFITPRSTFIPNEVNMTGQDMVRIRGDPIGVGVSQRILIKEIGGRLMWSGVVTGEPSFMNANASDNTLKDRCMRYQILKLGKNKFRYQHNTPGENRSYHHYDIGTNLVDYITSF